MVPSDLYEAIKKALSPDLKKPSLEANLEVCDLINNKPSNARPAIELLSKMVKREQVREVMLAISLLDHLVINCGYPIHLLVSKRDFMNAFVYRFPPNSKYPLDRGHKLALIMLGKWTVALGERSKYAGEFGNLKKIATLLTNNGFTIPKPKAEDVEAIIPTSNLNLQTREEVRREERIYYEAKLEDHLAKGTPADLKAANELMKVLAGYDPEEYSKADGIVEEGLDRLAERVQLLEQLLGNTDSSQWESNETIQTVYQECKDLMPKLLRLADSELDSNTMTRLLGLNEELRRVMALREEPNGLDLLQLNDDCTAEHLEFGSMSADALDLYNQQQPVVLADQVVAKYWLAEDLLIDWIQVGEVNLVRVTNLGPDLVQQLVINDNQIPILLSKETTILKDAFIDLHSVQIGNRNLSFTQLQQQ